MGKSVESGASKGGPRCSLCKRRVRSHSDLCPSGEACRSCHKTRTFEDCVDEAAAMDRYVKSNGSPDARAALVEAVFR